MNDKSFKPQLPKMDINKMLGDQLVPLANLSNLEIAEKTKREEEMLQTLKNIEANTVGLKEITILLNSNLEKQDEVLELLKDSLSISASKSKEEAESRWRKIMKKANDLTEDVETIQKVQGFANTIYQFFINNI